MLIKGEVFILRKCIFYGDNIRKVCFLIFVFAAVSQCNTVFMRPACEFSFNRFEEIF